MAGKQHDLTAMEGDSEAPRTPLFFFRSPLRPELEAMEKLHNSPTVMSERWTIGREARNGAVVATSSSQALQLPTRHMATNGCPWLKDMQKKNITATTIRKEHLSLQLCAKLFCLLRLAPESTLHKTNTKKLPQKLRRKTTAIHFILRNTSKALRA